jgi:hypothetical protein
MGIIGYQLAGTYTTASVAFQGTIDGTNWANILMANTANGDLAATATANGIYAGSCAGLYQCRANLTWTSGTSITVTAKSVPIGAMNFADVDMSDELGRLLGRITNYDVLENGTLGVLDATVSINASGLGTAGLGISGTWTGTIVVEGEVGNGVWDSIPLIDATLGSAALTTTSNGTFLLGIAGYLTVRVRMSVYGSGTATVYLEGTSAAAGVFFSRSIPTGLNSIGYVGSFGNRISLSPTVSTSAYTAGDAVGGLLTFSSAARASGDGGVIKDVLIIDDAGQDAEMELWLFNSTFTAMSDNAAWAPSEADLRKLVAIISTSGGAWFGAGTPSVARVECNQRYDLTATSMFGQLVTRGTPTFAATDDVTVIVGLLQD